MKYRIFTQEDQMAFAELSGDYNPLHVDPVAARRLLFGAQVVHGIHFILWGLDCLLEDAVSYVELSSIKSIFSRPLKVGEDVGLSIKTEDDGLVRMDMQSGGSVAARITVILKKADKREHRHLKLCFPEKRQPLSLSDDEIESRSGSTELYLNIEAAERMFPHAARYLSPVQIAVLLGTTRLLSTECPGTRSMYSELSLTAGNKHGPSNLQYQVTKLDRRFGLVLMNIIAPGMTGKVKAFIRPAHQKQAAYSELKELVTSNEFEGQRALIVGGSRGLGEVSAKLLAAGGADIKITYHKGAKDARLVADEITAGRGLADAVQFDVLDHPNDSLHTVLKNWSPTHLYYFATPFIFEGAKGVFSADLFFRFSDYYIKGFINTVNCLRDLGLKNVYCPSTIAIEELPLHMGEYAAAKAAAEILCTFLEKSHRDMTIHRPRLPRMSTDQTVSLLPVKNLDPVPVMLEHLRIFRDACARR